MLTTGPLHRAPYNVDDNNNNTVVLNNSIASSSSSGGGGGGGDGDGGGGLVVNRTATEDAVSGGTTSETTTLVLLHRIQPEEIAVLVVILILWAFAVGSFLRKWSRIRILQPMEPRYRHNPKNLESVLVVKRLQDSVIFKNYNRKMSCTMVAREKRCLQRMRTVPLLHHLPFLSHVQEVMEIPISAPPSPSGRGEACSSPLISGPVISASRDLLSPIVPLT